MRDGQTLKVKMSETRQWISCHPLPPIGIEVNGSATKIAATLMCGNCVRMGGRLNPGDSVLPWCTVTMVSPGTETDGFYRFFY